MKKLSLFLLGCALFTGCATHAPIRTVGHVDLQKYSGRWYEIARYPNSFQRKCVGAVTADYTPQPDGSIKVVNACVTKDGTRDTAVGRATVVPGSGNARLKVRFFGPFGGDYSIIGLADDYSWALVGHPSRDYLWILSRRPFMSPPQYEKIVALAVAQGYDAARIQRTNSRP